MTRPVAVVGACLVAWVPLLAMLSGMVVQTVAVGPQAVAEEMAQWQEGRAAVAWVTFPHGAAAALVAV